MHVFYASGWSADNPDRLQSLAREANVTFQNETFHIDKLSTCLSLLAAARELPRRPNWYSMAVKEPWEAVGPGVSEGWSGRQTAVEIVDQTLNQNLFLNSKAAKP